MILNARLGFARTLFVYTNQGLGFAPSSLGLPSYIDTAVDFLQFPGFTVTDYRGLGGGDHRQNAFMTYTAVASLTKTHGQAHAEIRHRYSHDAGQRVRRPQRQRSTVSAARMTQGPNPHSIQHHGRQRLRVHAARHRARAERCRPTIKTSPRTACMPPDTSRTTGASRRNSQPESWTAVGHRFPAHRAL